MKKLQPKGPLERRDRYLRAKYGLGVSQYAELLKRQGGGCALCGKTPKEEGKNLAVDHNHKKPYTVRGILCTYCNHRLVGRHTDPELLRRVAKYLENDTGYYAPEKKKKRRKRKK